MNGEEKTHTGGGALSGGEGVKQMLAQGVAEGVFPGAVLLFSQKRKGTAVEVLGRRCLLPRPLPMKRDTVFDLASLTKPLATTLALMKLVDSGRLALEQTLGDVIRDPLPRDKEKITLRLLLNHCSGLKEWEPYYKEIACLPSTERKRALRRRLVETPLAYEPGQGFLYSDLGFMLLEWVVEEATGTTMGRFLERNFYQRLGLGRTFLATEQKPGPEERIECAATENCPWRGRVIQGEVHDENAWVLGGYSGHAGLFGTVDEIFRIAEMLRDHAIGHRKDYLKPQTVRRFFRRQDIVSQNTWALGWDTPSKRNSSSGRYFSPGSVGHLGYTGTSLWMDLEKDVIVIFLTNRVHPTRINEKIREFRPRIHDRVMEVLGLDR